jgi:hypothetical protein
MASGAAPQGKQKAAVAPINSGLPTGGGAGTTDVVIPGRRATLPANKSNKVA